jgi:hypothetical protein
LFFPDRPQALVNIFTLRSTIAQQLLSKGRLCMNESFYAGNQIKLSLTDAFLP